MLQRTYPSLEYPNSLPSLLPALTTRRKHCFPALILRRIVEITCIYYSVSPEECHPELRTRVGSLLGDYLCLSSFSLALPPKNMTLLPTKLLQIGDTSLPVGCLSAKALVVCVPLLLEVNPYIIFLPILSSYRV